MSIKKILEMKEIERRKRGIINAEPGYSVEKCMDVDFLPSYVVGFTPVHNRDASGRDNRNYDPPPTEPTESSDDYFSREFPELKKYQIKCIPFSEEDLECSVSIRDGSPW